MRGDPAVTGRGRGSTKRSERSGRRRGWEREASKALAEGSHVEGHQQPRADGRQLHGGQDRRRVHRKQPLAPITISDLSSILSDLMIFLFHLSLSTPLPL